MATESNSTRIAKNTFFLYIRSFFILLISLYTSRVILKVLGIEDYGIYNVVGGVIGMLSFLNTSMASTYQRYFNYEMGKKNEKGVSDLFKSSVTVQLLYAVIIVIIAETLGLWFLNTQLIISPDRMIAARWVYQISIISFVIIVFQAPFTALIISYEKMNIFAIVSILDAILKLLIVFLLPFLNYDKLIGYATLLISITLLNFVIYVVICKKKFSTCTISLNWDKNNLKSLLSFGGWGMVGSLAYTLKSQGINIILNMFFGPVVNAARGIAYQVLHAVDMFVNNFQTSFRPQLTKSYAEGNLEYMYKLYYSATKISFYMLWCLSLPIIIETPKILSMWLGNSVPEYTITFTRIILLTALVSAYANPTSAIAYATGKIKKFIVWVSSINLLIVPIGYLFLKLGYGPESTMIVSLIMTVIVQIIRLIIIKKIIKFSITSYVKKVVLPTFTILILSPIIPIYIQNKINDSFFSCILICGISVLSVIILICLFGFNKEEKKILISKIKFLNK
ncbi:MAG: oligosaccharide flippase family protein [Bacteroidales bacterium]|nr:oligosaccharide flippase family protein [Bacteroidales bacterium]